MNDEDVDWVQFARDMLASDAAAHKKYLPDFMNVEAFIDPDGKIEVLK